MSFYLGQKVEVKWHRHGWLPGVVVGLSSPDIGEDFCRVIVKMNNRFACNGSGFHPDCLRASQIE
jgi:hypothetical protein